MANAKKAISKRKIVSSRVAKFPKKVSMDDPFVKLITSFFDKDLKKEFSTFLQDRMANVVPISKAKSAKKKRGKYKQPGMEPISFKEMTSYKNPLFSSPGPYSPAEYNPETIDVDTFTLMKRDPQLAVGLSVIKLPILALNWRIVCDDEKIGKTVEWALKKIWRDMIKTSMTAVEYGFASHEKVWERSNVKVSKANEEGKETVYHNGDLIYYKKIKPHHPESIKMEFDDKQNLVAIIQEGEVAKEEIKLPTRKCFLFTNDKEFGNPFGVSRLKNAYKIWYWKELLYQFMMQYYERRGTPPTVITAPPGKSTDSSGAQVDNMELALMLGSSLISSGVAVIPYQPDREGKGNMWAIDLLTDDARGPMFIEVIKHMDARCLRAIYVPEDVLTHESGGGYSSSSVHADVFLMSEKGLISDLEEAIDSQIINPFVEVNYPPEKRKPCCVKLDPLDWNRKIALKEIFIEMLRNIDTQIQMGVPPKIVPDLEKMAEIIEVPVETWGEAIDITPEEFIENMKTQKSGENSKVAGRKKTRSTKVDQTEERKRINPGGRRAERNRVTDTSKKK